MADDTNKDRSYAGGFTESGFDASIPVWDGKADSLREFRRMTTWWLHSINLERTKEFNLAARFAMKQKGAAKLRALEFTPEELAYIPAETAPDPDTDETLVITPAKYDAGIQKILDAWDQMVGRSLNDKKGELREKFYLHTWRNPQEAVMTFALRYRNLMSEMKQEGITIDDAEAAWFYKQKLGLSELQKQMMETTLVGVEEEFPPELVRLLREDFYNPDPQLHGRYQVTDDGDEVYLMPEASFAAQPVPRNKEVHVSVYLCDDEGCSRVWKRIQWSRLPLHFMHSKALAQTYDYYMVYYHNSDYEHYLELKTTGRWENVPRKKRAALVGEIFTDTEPIAVAAAWRGHTIMPSVTLKMGYDLYKETDRERCDLEVTRRKPFLLVLAFPCRVWSPLQHLSLASAPTAAIRLRRQLKQQNAKRKERRLVRYAVKKVKKQVQEGRHFLMENPAGSRAWNEVEELKRLREDARFYLAEIDMCQFGLRGPGGGLHRKRTWILTSSKEIYDELMAVPRCDGEHWHEPVIGGSRVTEAAGHYTKQFSEAVI
eukprot:symbB.v1.2.039784.t1/scaffold6784.1/size15560/1